MRTRPTILFYSPDACPVPALVRQWASANAFPLLVFSRPDEVEAIILRGHPSLLFVDGGQRQGDGIALVRRLKSDPFTGIVPVMALATEHQAEQVEAWFAAGADEVISGIFSPAEQRARLDAMLVRTERDVSVHPSTRLPGTTEIEREIRRRLDSGQEFAVCYADLDHFKEFNDRYSYYDGDRVIYLLSRILHDVVKGLLGPRGFVGHIGGDHFIFIIPLSEIAAVCGEILDIFDTLIPLQYNDQDRRAGYFFGKDRRGQLHRVPLMTLSVGIVTNRHRRFTHPAQVSELATEMKSYAKTLPGSVYVVDRRQGTNGEERPGPGSREPTHEDNAMNVTCPNCATVFRVDPAKVPEAGVRARCSVCSAVFGVQREGRPAAATAAATPSAVPATPGGAPAAPPPAPAPPLSTPRVPEAVTPPARPAPTPTVRPAPPAAAPGVAPRSEPVRPEPPRPAAPGAPPRPSVPPAAAAGPGMTAPAAAPPPAPAPPPAHTAPAPTRPAPVAGRPVNPFLSQDPAQKARRLARALVSDIVVYHPAKRQEGLRDGTLKELFEEEIRKSYEEYTEQVGRDLAESTGYFREALNEILAGGRQLF